MLNGIFMSYTIEDYLRETRQELLNSLTLEERLSGVPPQDLVNTFSKVLSSQEVVKSLSKEALKAFPIETLLKLFPIETLLKALPTDEVEKCLIKIKQKQ
jgi:hypothetical protein